MEKDLVVYMSLLLAGIIFAIVSLFVMLKSMTAFAILFAGYMLGYRIYMTVHLFKNREKGKTDIPIWVTLFTIFLSVLLAGMALVMTINANKDAMPKPTSYMYAPSAAAPSNPYKW